MLSWLSVLPIVGNIITGVSAYFNKKQDVDLEKYKVNGTVDIAAMQSDTEVIKARTELAIARKDDPVDRWGRRLFIYPTGVWFSLVVYDSCFRTLIPELTWRILALPDNLYYIPHCVVAYLLVNAWKKG